MTSDKRSPIERRGNDELFQAGRAPVFSPRRPSAPHGRAVSIASLADIGLDIIKYSSILLRKWGWGDRGATIAPHFVFSRGSHGRLGFHKIASFND